MDQTLQQKSQPLRKSPTQHVTWSSLAQAKHCAIALVLVVLVSGCQTNRLAQLGLPVPPMTLNRQAVDPAPETVRMQSPDNPGSDLQNRVQSLNSQFDDVDEVSADEKTKQTADRSNIVADLIIKGNKRVQTHHLTRNIRTRPGRYFDPDKLQQDVDELWRMKEISRINGPFLEHTAEGVRITIEVVERNTINQVDFVGNRGISDRSLKKETGLEDGAPLDVHQIRMAKTKIEEFYKDKGFPRTQVEILEGNEVGDAKVVFLIHEDQKQRIWKVDFEGNAIATDARLRHFIESKPGILKMIGGLVKRDEIEQDVLRLTNYYRSLGFFNARIGREISESNDGRWLTIHFIINEGPRYQVRNVSFVGNRSYEAEQLLRLVELKPGEDQPEFNVAKMNKDVVALRDLYGSQGYVFANVEAEPRFLEEPGLLDIVYKIEEGKQYRVGNINVHYEGGGGITKREVVLQKLGSVRPGDLIDAREIRKAERRLGSSQIFAGPGTPGAAPPRIVVRPPELQALQRHADAGPSSNYR
jgi:outer membrane protein insertion porin family